MAQAATAGSLKIGSSLNGAMVSSVMWRARCTAHSHAPATVLKAPSPFWQGLGTEPAVSSQRVSYRWPCRSRATSGSCQPTIRRSRVQLSLSVVRGRLPIHWAERPSPAPLRPGAGTSQSSGQYWTPCRQALTPPSSSQPRRPSAVARDRRGVLLPAAKERGREGAPRRLLV